MSGRIGERRDPASKSVEWYTPAWVFEELGLAFDLDPASPHDYDTAVPATTKDTKADNGLERPWHGRVWLNPPYGPDTGKWMQRMIEHNNGIALVFSRTDARWNQAAMRSATAMLFVRGRIEFVPGAENAHKKSRGGAGTVMFAFGAKCGAALMKMHERGAFFMGRLAA